MEIKGQRAKSGHLERGNGELGEEKDLKAGDKFDSWWRNLEAMWYVKGDEIERLQCYCRFAMQLRVGNYWIAIVDDEKKKFSP